MGIINDGDLPTIGTSPCIICTDLSFAITPGGAGAICDACKKLGAQLYPGEPATAAKLLTLRAIVKDIGHRRPLLTTGRN